MLERKNARHFGLFSFPRVRELDLKALDEIKSSMVDKLSTEFYHLFLVQASSDFFLSSHCGTMYSLYMCTTVPFLA